ncbi:MAG: NosD domain-containing protein [Candidatus Thermoplasmatota archaeon]|nr:NosD domain-containing protein [Candidatus Thermoplasmatota archaeon]
MMSGLVVVSGPSEASGNAGIKAPTLTPHDPIHIDGNGDFTFENGVSSGSGTESDPYIIENWDINASSADLGHGIEVYDTDVHFVIKNCYIHDGKRCENATRLGNSGIIFYNVINGKIENLTGYNNERSIDLYHASKIAIISCVVYGNCCSMLFSHSSDNIIINCTLYNNYNGIHLLSSSNTTITNCHIHNNTEGIRLGHFSNNNTIINTTISNNEHGIYLASSSNSNTICYNRFVDNVEQFHDEGSNYWYDNEFIKREESWLSKLWKNPLLVPVLLVLILVVIAIAFTLGGRKKEG